MPDQEPTPAPPPSGPGPELGPKSTSTGLPSNVAAALACIPLIGGIIFYIVEKHDSFVRFYAMQSIIFGGAWLLFNIVSKILFLILWSIPAIGGILVFFWGIIQALVHIAFLVVWIVATVKAFTGVRWDIPYIGPVARGKKALCELFKDRRPPRLDSPWRTWGAVIPCLPVISRLLPSESARDLAVWSRVLRSHRGRRASPRLIHCYRTDSRVAQRCPDHRR